MSSTHLHDLTEDLLAALDEGRPTDRIVTLIGDALPDHTAPMATGVCVCGASPFEGWAYCMRCAAMHGHR